jgi:hypothetical protein
MVRAWQESVRTIRSNPMAGIRTNSRLATGLLVELRRDGPDPLHRQISATIRDGIRSGRLGLGTSLPPDLDEASIVAEAARLTCAGRR